MIFMYRSILHLCLFIDLCLLKCILFNDIFVLNVSSIISVFLIFVNKINLLEVIFTDVKYTYGQKSCPVWVSIISFTRVMLRP